MSHQTSPNEQRRVTSSPRSDDVTALLALNYLLIYALKSLQSLSLV